ncbi:matrixin family metalloprotease [bacterium]|nr:matrixin family metalloprotease [bacterium]
MRRVRIVVALATLFAAAAPAHAYKYTKCAGVPCFWDGFPVGFEISHNVAELYGDAPEDAQNAMRRWNHNRQTFCQVELNMGGMTPIASSGADFTNVIHAEPDWPYDKQVLAVTQCFYESTGRVVDCDIAVNTRDWGWHDGPADGHRFNFSDTMTHEAGHFWGLDHSSETYATMSAFYNDKTLARDLDEDDILANADRYCDSPLPADDAREPNDSARATGPAIETDTFTDLRLYDTDIFRVNLTGGVFPKVSVKDRDSTRRKIVRVTDKDGNVLGSTRCDGDCAAAPIREAPDGDVVLVWLETDFEKSAISTSTYDIRIELVSDVGDEDLFDDDIDDEDDDAGGDGCGFFGTTVPPSAPPGLGLVALALAMLAMLASRRGRTARASIREFRRTRGSYRHAAPN